MSKCAGCNKSVEPIEAVITGGIDFLRYKPDRNRVRTAASRSQVGFDKAFPYMKPPEGWRVVVHYNDTHHEIKGRTATEVFRAVREFYLINGEQISDEDLWYNLNYVWTKQFAPKNTLVSHEILSAIRVDTKYQELEKVSSVGIEVEKDALIDRSPLVWGSKGWGILQIYLAKKNFDPEVFLSLINIVTGLLEDEKIGCVECLEHFEESLLKLTLIPTQEQAREWLFETMNKVNISAGKPVMSKEEAWKVNLWS